MAIVNYVEQILNSPVYIFDEIIEKLTGKNIHFAKTELSRYKIIVDDTLLESIKLILKELREEEGVFSRFLYATFGVELRKNKRREQLIYLGSELKTQHIRIKKRLYTLNRQRERLEYSIVDLGRLQKSFSQKNISIENSQVKNKSKFYINEIADHIKKLEEYQFSLLMKYNDLTDIEKIYYGLFKKIPRYHELQEETHLLLLSPVKK